MFKLLDVNSVVLNLEATNRREILVKLVDLLHDRVTNREECLDAILCREALYTTDVGFGFSLPTAKSNSVTDLSISIAILPKGVSSLKDIVPVTVFILIISPITRNNEYLRVRAIIEQASMDKSFKKSLLEAKSRSDVVDIVSSLLSGVEC